MYVIDITRDNHSTDMLVGNDSMSAKSKTINYIMDYVFANYDINLNKDVLDQNLNISRFSLKQFLSNNCLFLKYIDNNEFPLLYSFDKKDIKKVQAIMTFLVNDTLISKYKDNLEKYDRLKIDYNNKKKLDITKENIGVEIISLYNGGMFLEELLNNRFSLRQLQNMEESIYKTI